MTVDTKPGHAWLAGVSPAPTKLQARDDPIADGARLPVSQQGGAGACTIPASAS